MSLPPMTLELLKQLSERAAPLLAELGDRRDQFLAEEGDSYHGLKIEGDSSGNPLAGTPMVGGVSGHYEPEWDEQTCWESLRELVRWHFAEDAPLPAAVKFREYSSFDEVFADAEAMREALKATAA